MRLLRRIARALGAAPPGSTAQILATVHSAARRHAIDTPGSLPGHAYDTDMADRWLPDINDLTDMALQINMRTGAHHVGRSLSPIRSVTPPGWPSHRNRPPATEVYKTDYQTDEHHSCVRPGCPCTSTFNGKHCCRTCQRGRRCADNYHPHPMQHGQPHGRHRPDRPHTQLTYPHCVTPGCSCTATFNGEPG